MTTPVEPIIAAKARLRAEVLARRDGLGEAQRRQWDGAITQHLLSLPVWSKGPVAAFWPMRSEVDPRGLMQGLAARGLTLCLPAVAQGDLQFRRWAFGAPLVPGGFGTRVPPPEAEVLSPAVLIVPLAAFDRRGFRLGYGKGYYDRALAALPGARGIGVAYAAQEVGQVPTEAHDMALDMIVTETGAICPLRA